MTLETIEELLARAGQALIGGDPDALARLSQEIEAALPALQHSEPGERLVRLQESAARARDLALAALQGLTAAKTRQAISGSSVFYGQNGRRQKLGAASQSGHHRA